MTRNPTLRAVKLDVLRVRYGATFFRDALARYVVKTNNPQMTQGQVERASASVYFNFRAVSVGTLGIHSGWPRSDHGLTASSSRSRVLRARDLKTATAVLTAADRDDGSTFIA